MIVELYRHAMTNANERRAYVGSTDEPISPRGEKAIEAIDTAEQLVWVSPALRARQSASILFPNARQLVVEDFREMDFGVFELRTADDLAFDDRYRAWVDGGCLGQCPEGESLAIFQKRCTDAFSSLMAAWLTSNKELVRIVAHGGTVMAILDAFSDPHRDYFDWHVGFGSCVRCMTNASLWSHRILSVQDAGVTKC